MNAPHPLNEQQLLKVEVGPNWQFDFQQEDWTYDASAYSPFSTLLYILHCWLQPYLWFAIWEIIM